MAHNHVNIPHAWSPVPDHVELVHGVPRANIPRASLPSQHHGVDDEVPQLQLDAGSYQEVTMKCLSMNHHILDEKRVFRNPPKTSTSPEKYFLHLHHGNIGRWICSSSKFASTRNKNIRTFVLPLNNHREKHLTHLPSVELHMLAWFSHSTRLSWRNSTSTWPVETSMDFGWKPKNDGS